MNEKKVEIEEVVGDEFYRQWKIALKECPLVAAALIIQGAEYQEVAVREPVEGANVVSALLTPGERFAKAVGDNCTMMDLAVKMQACLNDFYRDLGRAEPGDDPRSPVRRFENCW